MEFELDFTDIAILFFLTLGPLKAILPFARLTHGADPALRHTLAWRPRPSRRPSFSAPRCLRPWL
jgi:hypothetical protein